MTRLQHRGRGTVMELDLKLEEMIQRESHVSKLLDPHAADEGRVCNAR